MAELYSEFCYRGSTAHYRFSNQQWCATVKRDEAPFLHGAAEIIATAEEGEAMIVERIQAYIDRDIASSVRS